ncbi:MAG: DUF2892 domain-containing protein [Nitrospirota bacterium]|jgi:hypothetical protein
MNKNMGTLDRAIRVTAGLSILSLAFVGPRSKWASLGGFPLVTGAVGWCPVYELLDLSTRRKVHPWNREYWK